MRNLIASVRPSLWGLLACACAMAAFSRLA